MTRLYYKGAMGCIVMFDVTNSTSFQNCHYWKQDLDNKTMLPNGRPIPCILLANKVIQCIQSVHDTLGELAGLAQVNKYLAHVFCVSYMTSKGFWFVD